MDDAVDDARSQMLARGVERRKRLAATNPPSPEFRAWADQHFAELAAEPITEAELQCLIRACSQSEEPRSTSTDQPEFWLQKPIAADLRCAIATEHEAAVTALIKGWTGLQLNAIPESNLAVLRGKACNALAALRKAYDLD